MKKIAKQLAGLLCLLLLIPCFAQTAIANTTAPSEFTFTEEEKAAMRSQAPAMDAAMMVSALFDNDEYGGMYIDGDNNLHIYTFQDTVQELQREYPLQSYITHPSTYSLSELNNSMDYAVRLSNILNIHTNMIGVDEARNCVVITMKKLDEVPSDWDIQILQNDIYLVEYEENDIICVEESTLVKPGVAVHTDGGTFSLAFMAKRNGQIGFVTAGHCWDEWTAPAVFYGASGSTQIGNFTSYREYHPVSDKIVTNSDCAFIKRTNSNYIPSSVTNYSGYTMMAASEELIISGADAHLEGYRSHHQTGKITLTNTCLYQYLNHRIVSTYSSNHGDSGGCVWVGYYDSSAGQYKRYIVGVHNGSYYYDPESQEQRLGGYASRIDQVRTALGITYYPG